MNHVPGRLAAALATVLVLAAGAGCSSGGPVPDPAAALRSRPTLDQISTTYQHMLDDLHTALARVLGPDGWNTIPAPIPTALCQQFGTQYDTGVRFLPPLTRRPGVPEPQWTEILGIITEITGRYGFNPPVQVVNRPDDHSLDLTDQYGADLTIEQGPPTLDFTLRTGCHLRPGAPPP